MDFAIDAAVTLILAAAGWIDYRRRILPDPLLLAIFALGVARVAWLGAPWQSAALGAFVGGGFFFAVRTAAGYIKKKEALGLGDVKLMLAAGAYLGLARVCVAMLAGTLLGAVAAVALLCAGRVSREDELPFGPALCLGAAFALWFGEPIAAWYLGALYG